MKKLRLNLEELTVTSFATDSQAEQRGTVYGHDSYETRYACMTWEAGCDNEPSAETRCLCTDAEGCYPSAYCSGGYPNLTCVENCMTNENGQC